MAGSAKVFCKYLTTCNTYLSPFNAYR